METSIDVDVNELWSAIWCTDGSGIRYWTDAVRDVDGNPISLWTGEDLSPNPQDFRLFIDDDQDWRTVTIADLVRGYGIAVQNNAHHCGGYLVADLDDPDECTGDTLLQYAVFGELIYG